jgi:purine nucleosidase/pyrimidine-specific ribonucleoside hydrolase
MPQAVIIDTDPGLDDALAILCALASPALRVLGLTSVAGNIELGMTTRNAGRLLALAGRGDVPVVAGAAGPLARRGFDVADIHGEGGLGGVALPEPLAAPLTDAPGWMAAQLMAAPAGSIDILALGPMTNIAALIRDAPEAASRLRRIIAMGGAIDTHGNIGPHSEFNMAADPEAAQIVLDAGLPLVLVPLDVTRQVRADGAWIAALASAPGAPARTAAALLAAYLDPAQGRISRPLHDPCVMLLAEAPALFTLESMTLRVDTSPEGAARSTITDPGALHRDARGAPVHVAMGVAVPDALALLARRLGGQE